MKRSLSTYCYMLLLISTICNLHSYAQTTERTHSTIIDSLETALKSAKEDTTRINILNELCQKYDNRNSDKALEYGNQALALSRKLIIPNQRDIKKAIATSINSIGLVYTTQGNYKKAMNHYRQSLKLFEELGNKKEIALTLNDIGVVHLRQGNYEKAIDFYLKSIKIREEIGDEHGIAGSLHNIAMMYDRQGNYEKALEFYFRALEINEKLDNKHWKSFNLGNIGGVYFMQGKHDNAIKYMLKALKINEKRGDKSAMASSLNNLGVVSWGQENYDKALDFFLKSLNMYRELGEKHGIALCLINSGIMYQELAKYERALRYCKEGLSIAKEIGAKDEIRQVYEALSEIYALRNNFKKAYEYNLLHSDIKDSLFNEESSKQIVEMQEKYESEKREKEIEFLNKEKALQSTELNRQKIIIWSGAGGLLLVIALAFFIYRGYRQKKKANVLLAAQKQVIEVKNKDITDSIRYAEQIQQAILPTDEQIKELLPDSFVLFKPKDIVSGDFYWITALNLQSSTNKSSRQLAGGSPDKSGRGILFAVCDCTGHGVPGAFMSMIGNALLNETVNEKGITQPNEILNEIRKGIINSLKQKGEIGEQQDGMDAALCAISPPPTPPKGGESANAQYNLQYAGANNPLFIIRKGELIETKADKQPIGIVDDLKPFTNHSIELQKGDTIYIFSDGFSDQFGGSKNKKFTTKRLKQLFLNIQKNSMPEQKEILNKTLEEWKGDEEQLDDILVIGVRV